jgi:hypothetical protein
MDVAVGAIVTAAGLFGFFVALAGRVRALYAEADRDARAGAAES